MDPKRIGHMIVGTLLTAASMIMIPIEASRGDILLTISGGCFGIAGLAFLYKNMIESKSKNKNI